ncbi:hypothetical protein D3C71_630200 [compost metagenome]
MAGTLADAAIGDDGRRAVDALLGIDRLDLFCRFEGSILVDDCAPRNIDGAGDVTGTDGQLLDAIRRENLAGIFIRRTDIHQLDVVLALGHRNDVDKARPDRGVGLGEFQFRFGRCRCGCVERQALRLPKLAATIQQLYAVAKTVGFENPRTPGGKPVVVVAI